MPFYSTRRISERSAPEVEGHGFFEGEADGREVGHAWTHLDVREGCAQRLAVSGGVGGHTLSCKSDPGWAYRVEGWEVHGWSEFILSYFLSTSSPSFYTPFRFNQLTNIANLKSEFQL